MLYRSETGLSLTTNGHAQSDICVAVSMLAQTAAAYLGSLVNVGLLTRLRVGPGRLELDAKTQRGADHVATLSTVHGLLESGLLQLESQYPDEIRVDGALDMAGVKAWRETHFSDPV